MWRSFFLAVGIGLMLLGVEALVVERLVVDESAKLRNLLNGLFEIDVPDSFAHANFSPEQRNPALQNSSFRNSDVPNYQRVPYSPASRFGPSRFSGPQAGNYGGGRVDLSRSGINSNNSQTANAFPVSFPNGPSSAVAGGDVLNPKRTRGTRTILTKDWMPWSLLAAGAIIFLYTSSNGLPPKD